MTERRSKRLTHKERMDLIHQKQVMRNELARANAERFLSATFTHQREFIEDPSQLKAVLATRRASKSWAAAFYLLSTALLHPRVNCLYVVPLKVQAWRDMLSDNGAMTYLMNKYNVKEATLHQGKYTITLPNKSIIYFMGLDTSPRQAKALLGGKYKLAIFDESGSFDQDLRDMVMRLKPAMVEKGATGTICLIGTPENYRNFFYQVTEKPENLPNGREPGWKVFEWSYKQNPETCDEIDKDIEKLRVQFPGIDTNPDHELYPMFRQHYCGEWVIDRTAKVYAFDYARNVIPELPPGDYTYHAGIDWGYVDEATIITVAYKPHDPTLYVVDCFYKAGLDPGDMALEMVRYDEHYKYVRKVADHEPSNIQYIGTKYSIWIEEAPKIEKVGAIEMMNADWLRGRIKIVHKPVDPSQPGHQANTEALIKELEKLIWNKKLLDQGIKKELQTKPNHACDALLYIWRALYHYLAKPELKKEEDPMRAYSRMLKRKTSERIANRLHSRKRTPFK